MGQLGQRLLTATGRNYGDLVFCSIYNAPTLFNEIYK